MLTSAASQISRRIGYDHVTHRLMIFDVAGAAAEVTVEHPGYGLLEIRAGDRCLRQSLEQDLALVEKTRGAIAALEGELGDKSLLQSRQLAVLRMAFDRADRLAVEACGRHDAGWARVARPVGTIDDDRAAHALRGAAAEFGAGQSKVFAQEVIHHQIVAHLARAVDAAVDGDGERRHLGAAASAASLSMTWVTGSDQKRRPVASKMALSRAGTTGIITTSAIPFGRSFASTGGKISISRLWRGRSEPRATRYCPRFHFPFPGPSSKSGSDSSS